MQFNRTKNATKTFTFGVISKIITIIFPFITRTIIIYKLGAEYVGLTGLFTSVLQILNVSELGISSAISFCLYEPIAKDDKNSINALMALMRKLYKIIGVSMLVVGLLLLPFLDRFISGTYPETMNIYILYIIYLVNSSVSYLGFAYKGVLFEAYQQGDINHKIISITEVFKYVGQIVILLCFANYYWFAAMLPICSILVTVITECISRKKHPDIIPKGNVSNDVKATIKKKVLFLSVHSVAATLTNSIDNIVITGALGLIATAIYGNYFYIYSAITSVLVIAFRALKPVVGNSIYVDNAHKRLELFNVIQFVIGWITMWSSACLLCLYQPFMELWVGEQYLVDVGTVVMIVLYFYGNVIKLLFSNIYIDAAGLWNKTLIRQIVVALLNLVLDLALVKKYGIAGIVFASFFSTAIVALPLDIIVTYKYVLDRPIKQGLMRVITQFALSAVICLLTYCVCSLTHFNPAIDIVWRTLICSTVPNLIMTIIYNKSSEFMFVRNHISTLIRR